MDLDFEFRCADGAADTNGRTVLVEARCADDARTGRILGDLAGVLREEVIGTGHKLRAIGDVCAGDNNHAVEVDFNFGTGGYGLSCCADGVVERCVHAAQGCGFNCQAIAACVDNVTLDQVFAGEYGVGRRVARRRAAAVDEPNLATVRGVAGVASVEDVTGGHDTQLFLYCRG